MKGTVQTDKTTTCLSCHSTNMPEARFCNNCGTTIPAVVAAADADTLLTSNELVAQGNLDPVIGLTIEGKYRIEGLIGTGGMGAVYRATRLLIGDEVAIKILHSERVVDPHASERFRREAQAAARLKHPNAVSIYDFGVSQEGLQYLVMELIEGRSLREVSRQQGTLDPSLAAEVTSQVCAALDEAHRQHIVHRDIKPDNIILHSSGSGLRVKVLDFGIAKLRDDTASHLTQTGSVMGTPHYMSPEQCLGEELDNRADIYSVGVVLYELLCGRVPFDSPISTAVVVQHVNQQPPSLRTLNPAISPQMEAAVLRALEKRREARPQTAGAYAREVATAFGRSASGYEKPWVGQAPQPAAPVSDDERTIEKHSPASVREPSRASQEMPPTLHLASVSGATGPVVHGRATGAGAVSTATLKPARAQKYAIVVLSIALLGVLIALLSWRALRTDEPNANSQPKASPENAGPISGNTNSGRLRDAPAPPAGMTFVTGATFMMGSNNGDVDSKPQHSVTVKPFFIDINEVTCAEYKKFIDATGHNPPQNWKNGTYPLGTTRYPVTGVTWADADAYARSVGKRLPTEAEWEFAARGPKGLMYPWGNSWKPGCANADREGNAQQGMTDVGTHNCGSPFGAEDMIGNAWEWTATDWAAYPDGHLQYRPKGGEKVIRGGSWESAQKIYATSVFRSGFLGAGDKTGFRCAKDASP